ncbi:MAG TPA: hypothetical protein GX530_10255 [Corynebacteriales bacterium]|nr:hypothetical protein [Mycobacteriales bacterium]
MAIDNISVSREQIDEWKAKYGKVYAVEINDIMFYFYPISRPQYREIMNNLSGGPSEREEQLCQMLVLHPAAFDYSSPAAPAGIATVLSEIILDKSGFAVKGEPKEL